MINLRQKEIFPSQVAILVRICSLQIVDEIVTAKDKFVIFLYAIVRYMSLTILKVSQVKMSSANSQICLLVYENTHGVE